jgi:glycogen debranching enzyme
VAAFGRDTLLIAHLLLPHGPDLAAGTLRYLAPWQSDAFDAAREAEPGKIMNEVRFGDLTRMGEMPYSPNYGSVHSTPLFLMLLASRPSGSGRPPG